MFLEKIPGLIDTIRKMAELGKAKGVARRLFVTNSFDGLLTSLGVILGGYIGGLSSPLAYIGAVLGGSLTMGIFSGFVGAFFSERAERKKELKEMETQVLKDLSKTIYGKMTRLIPFYVAFWSSLGMVLFPLITVSPFLLSYLGLFGIDVAIPVSIVIVNVLVFVLGVYLGSVSGESKLRTGLTMVSTSFAATIVLTLISIIV